MAKRETRPLTLEQHRRWRMMTQRDLAKAAKCGQQTIVSIERGGRSTRFDTMRRISAALGVEPRDVAEFRRAIEIDFERPARDRANDGENGK